MKYILLSLALTILVSCAKKENTNIDVSKKVSDAYPSISIDKIRKIDDKFHEIKEKIEKKNLSECIKLNFYRGLVTGFKEAFIVDTAQKNKICLNDKHSENLFFKVLEGKNINKFSFFQW